VRFCPEALHSTYASRVAAGRWLPMSFSYSSSWWYRFCSWKKKEPAKLLAFHASTKHRSASVFSGERSRFETPRAPNYERAVCQFAWLKAASLVLVDFWKVCSSFVVAKRFRAHLCCTETRRHSSECRETDLNSEVGGPEPKPRGNGIQRVGKLCLPQETDPHDRCNQHFDPKINGPPPLQLWLLHAMPADGGNDRSSL